MARAETGAEAAGGWLGLSLRVVSGLLLGLPHAGWFGPSHGTAASGQTPSRPQPPGCVAAKQNLPHLF